MKKTFLFLLTSALLLFFSFHLAIADDNPCADPSRQDDCTKQIQDLTAKIAASQTQQKTLAGQIAYYDDQIALATLKITQSEENLASITAKINLLETSLKDRSRLLAEQIAQSYKQGPVDGLQLFFSSSGFSQFIVKFKYAQLTQELNRQSLYQNQVVQSDYAQQKQLVQDAQTKIESQKAALTSLRSAKDTLLQQTKNDEATYQKLLAQAIAQREAINSFITAQGGASILTNQTFCDDWGCYYNQRDSLWGNLPLGSSSYPVSRYGCLVTSVAMIASHNHKNIKPSDIALTPSAFFLNTGDLNYNITVNGVNISRSYSANIDQQLAAGNPVIVGVYNGPAHFVVLKSGSNGHYVMDDPYVENGHDINFTDHYPLSSITYTGILTFN